MRPSLYRDRPWSGICRREVESAYATGTRKTVPSAPTGVTATAGNAQATVSFTASSDTGGSTILGYTVLSSPGNFSANTTGTEATVTGLTNGTSYSFTVRALNGEGLSEPSNPSNSVVPRTVPSVPRDATATTGNTQATVAFVVPSSDGGAAITGYTATSDPGSFTGTAAASPITVTGLTNGTSYTFTVVATNVAGDSPASNPSNQVTPVTVPGAPTIGTATGGNAEATVTFTPPVDDGGSAITGYTATSSPGGFTATGASSPLTVTGLANGTAYTFTVTATNSVGTSTASAASNSVTPATVPDAPTIGTATAGDTTASVAFTDNGTGGSAITGHTATSTPGSFTGTGTSPITVTGLTNDTSYTFTVHATNAVGDSAESAASNSVTPTAPVWATLDPAAKNAHVTLSGGNLVATGDGTNISLPVKGDMSKSSGKWYFEVTVTTFDTECSIGICTSASSVADGKYVGSEATSYGYYEGGVGGTFRNNGSNIQSGLGALATAIVVGVLLDADADTLIFWRDGVAQGTPISISSGATWLQEVSVRKSCALTVNSGASSWAHEPTTGYVGWSQ